MFTVILTKGNVLNLVINGWPSIHKTVANASILYVYSFKPCYKWMTFNTLKVIALEYSGHDVLNLVINGWPSIHVLEAKARRAVYLYSFKPCYKWMTFNTLRIS